MASAFARIISKRILKESAQNHFGQEDPYFEHVPATRLDGRPTGKLKKRRKALPPGISDHDGKVLTKVKRRAYRLDNGLCNFCGIRFGWSSLIGIIPGLGDVLDLFMAMMVLRTCEQIDGGLSGTLKSRMMFNIMIDFAIGLVPFAGDLADALYRCNTRNAVLLEKHLREKGRKNIQRQGQQPPALDPSHEDYFDRESEDLVPPPRYQNDPNMNNTRPEPTKPATAKVSKESRGWFGGSRQREPDLESGGMQTGVIAAR